MQASLDEQKQVKSVEVINGVKITTYADGSQHFDIVEKTLPKEQPEEKSFWQKLKDWWNNSDVTPYATIKDLNNGTDTNDENESVPAVEIGVSMKF